MHVNMFLFTPLLVAVLLVACGGQQATQEAPEPTNRNLTPNPIASEATRTVEHPLGMTEAPEDPQRVVAVTGTEELDALAALGVKPIAAAEIENGLGFTEQATPLLDGVTILPTRRGINLELVALQEPDLIIGAQGWLGDIYDELSQIAPTVAINSSTSWHDILNQVALVIGREDQAEAIIAEINTEIDTLADRYRNNLEGMTYTLMSPSPDEGMYRLYHYESDVDHLLQQLGMVRTEQQLTLFEVRDSHNIQLSIEQLDIIDTDAIFVLVYDVEEADTMLQTVRKGPFFSRLKAVEAETVFFVNYGSWNFSSSLAMEQVIIDLEQEIIPQLLDRPIVSTDTEATTDTCEDGFRSIDTAYGPTCIPVTPERIIALNEGVMTNLLALEVTPIGVVDYANRDFTHYLGDTTAQVASVGTPDGANFEAMLALDPDLIVGMDFVFYF